MSLWSVAYVIRLCYKYNKKVALNMATFYYDEREERF